MDREKKLKIIWSCLAGFFIAAAAIMLTFGIVAAVIKNRTSDFLVDTTGVAVAAVYENDGYCAVGTQDGSVLLYDENDTATPVFTYSFDGLTIRDMSIDNGRLYVAASDRYVYVFELEGGGNYAAKCRVGLVPERMFFDGDSDSFAVYGVSDSSNRRGIYFLPKDAAGDTAYVTYIEEQTAVESVTLSGDTAYYLCGQLVYSADISGRGRITDMTQVYSSDVSLKGITRSGDGFAVIDADGGVSLFDWQFGFYKKENRKTETISTAFSSGGIFVCKQRGGGIIGIDPQGGEVFSVATGADALIVYGSPDSFAYLTEDGGAFKYYTLEMAHKAQLYRSLSVPFIAVGAVLVLVAAYATASIFERSRRAVNGFFKKLGKTLVKHKFAYLSLIPTFLLLAIFYWYPIVSSLFMSFFDYLPGEYMRFAGLENFKMVFLNTEYWVSFKNTLIFLVTDLLKALLPPIIFAECLLALRSKRTSYIIRVLLFIPGILPGVASMLVWADGIFGATSSGLLNGLISAIVPSWVSKAWLMNDKTALTSLIFMNFPWVGSYLIFFGAISGIDKEVYEAAKLDGCGWLRRVIKIDIPLIVPQIKYIFIQTFIASVQNYTLILITTGGDYGTNTPALMMYYATAVQKNYGVASAMGLILLLFLMVATIINFKMQIGDGSKKKKKRMAEAV